MGRSECGWVLLCHVESSCLFSSCLDQGGDPVRSAYAGPWESGHSGFTDSF